MLYTYTNKCERVQCWSWYLRAVFTNQFARWAPLFWVFESVPVPSPDCWQEIVSGVMWAEVGKIILRSRKEKYWFSIGSEVNIDASLCQDYCECYKVTCHQASGLQTHLCYRPAIVYTNLNELFLFHWSHMYCRAQKRYLLHFLHEYNEESLAL